MGDRLLVGFYKCLITTLLKTPSKLKKHLIFSIVGPVAYLLPNWRHLMLACSIPSILSSIAYWLIVPESFHFMMSKKMEPQLDKWLNKANKPRPIVTVNAKTLIAEHMRNLLQDTNRDRSLVVQLCAHKKLLLYVVVLSYLWLSDTMLYYGLSLYSSDLAGNKVHFIILKNYYQFF